MKKAKTRLKSKIAKRRRILNQAFITVSLLTCTLWGLTIYFIKLADVNFVTKTQARHHYRTITNTEVQAKEIEVSFTPSSNTIRLINNNPDLSSKIKQVFADDWQYAAELIARESSFNKYAVNPSSGACGLAQSLPCKKMACELADEDCQIKWIKNYVDERYGGIKEALNFHDNNNWY